VLFVLSGLKPCLFFSNLPVSWRRPFTEEVAFASGILDHSSAECSPLLRVVAADVRTPAEYSLSSTLVLVNTNHPACSTIDETLHLLPVPMPLVGDLPSCDRSVHTVEEPTLAQLLDYPVALDECVDPMIEVRESRPCGLLGFNQELKAFCSWVMHRLGTLQSRRTARDSCCSRTARVRSLATRRGSAPTLLGTSRPSTLQRSCSRSRRLGSHERARAASDAPAFFLNGFETVRAINPKRRGSV
jgi:hypothetical protein